MSEIKEILYPPEEAIETIKNVSKIINRKLEIDFTRTYDLGYVYELFVYSMGVGPIWIQRIEMSTLRVDAKIIREILWTEMKLDMITHGIVDAIDRINKAKKEKENG